MTAPASDPDKADVQRLIVYTYRLRRSRHFVLQVKDPAKARSFIWSLVNERFIANASVDHEAVTRLNDDGFCPTHIGFTFRGLEKLELDVPYLRVFQEKAKAFAEGAVPRAARRLADVGSSAAPSWDPRFAQDDAHVLLCTYGDEESELDQFEARLKGLPDAQEGLKGWDLPFKGRSLTTAAGTRVEHFGFRDGISNPRIRGFHEWRSGPKLHEPGEFLLGYRNDSRFNPWLLVNPWPRPNPWLLPLNPACQLREFFRNGSFAAFRQMQQDVGSFRDSVDIWADQLGGGRDQDKWREYVRAKLSGRWSSGAVVRPGQTENDAPAAPPADLNDFDFLNDKKALGCRFGAHIRRMNPRSDPVVPLRGRPVIRRGMPYGPTFEEEEKAERGLLGLFFCASLEDQVEHLLVEWGNANPMGPANRGNSKDPLVGNRPNPRAVFDIPIPGENLRQLDGFRQYVTTRGTLYAFFPSLTTIGRIAFCGTPAS